MMTAMTYPATLASFGLEIQWPDSVLCPAEVLERLASCCRVSMYAAEYACPSVTLFVSGSAQVTGSCEQDTYSKARHS